MPTEKVVLFVTDDPVQMDKDLILFALANVSLAREQEKRARYLQRETMADPNL